jgi:hypothetical protein
VSHGEVEFAVDDLQALAHSGLAHRARLYSKGRPIAMRADGAFRLGVVFPPMIKERQLPNHFGHTRTQFEAVTGLKRVPGFVVYLYLYENQAFALNPLI